MIRRPPRSTRTDTPFPTRRSSGLGVDAGVVGVAVADRLVEDARVGSQPGDRILVDVARQRAVVEQGAGDVVQPQALAEIVQLSGRFHARSEEHTSELQSLMRISYAVFCLTKKKYKNVNSKY